MPTEYLTYEQGVGKVQSEETLEPWILNRNDRSNFKWFIVNVGWTNWKIESKRTKRDFVIKKNVDMLINIHIFRMNH